MLQQHHNKPALERRGITGTQIVLIMAILAIGSTTLTIILNRFSAVSREARCQFNLQALQTGFTNYALANQTTPPLPDGMYGPDNDGKFFTTATAELHTTLLTGKYIRLHQLICPGEKNPLINTADLKKDFDPENDLIKADIDGNMVTTEVSWSNISYANRSHVDPMGIHSQSYRNFERATTIRFGDRGPKGGLPDPQSYTNFLHGPATTYQGNFVFADGHVETLTQHSPNQTTPLMFLNLTFQNVSEDDNNPPSPQPDNIFAPQGNLGSNDQFLAIFRVDPADPQKFIAIWD